MPVVTWENLVVFRHVMIHWEEIPPAVPSVMVAGVGEDSALIAEKDNLSKVVWVLEEVRIISLERRMRKENINADREIIRMRHTVMGESPSSIPGAMAVHRKKAVKK
jgi:hypothetical protein